MQAEIDEAGCLRGVSIPQLVEKYGSPLYIYDIDRINEQHKKMADNFSKFPYTIHFAAKSNANISILRHMGKIGCGIDAVSPWEVETSLLCGIPREKIVFTPSGPLKDDFDSVVDQGILITVDSLSLIKHYGEKYPDGPGISIRINHHIKGGGDEKICTATKDSKFGISIDFLDQIKQTVKESKVKVIGLHMHTGSAISNHTDYFAAIDVMVEIAEDFKDLKFLDFGSGFKVKYFKPEGECDTETDMAWFSEELLKRWQLIKERDNRELEFKFEPGKFLIADAGYLAAHCTGVKQGPICTFVHLNTGLNHLINPMMYAKAFHRCSNISNPSGPMKEYTVVGNICETDTFGKDRKLHEVSEGDIIMLHGAGAYGFSMASTYNLRARPAEVAISNGQSFLIRERETLSDLLHGQASFDFN